MPANHFAFSLLNLDRLLSCVMTAQIYPFRPFTIWFQDRPLSVVWITIFGELKWLFFNEIAGVWFFEELADMIPCHHQKSSIRNQMIRITLFDHYRTEKSYDIKTWLIKKAQTCTHKTCNQFTCTTESKYNWKLHAQLKIVCTIESCWHNWIKEQLLLA